MASIRKRGKNSWQIIVSNGYDHEGHKKTEPKTVKRPVGMTNKQWEKELNRIAVEFETQIQKGLVLDGNVSLKGFVDRWIDEYASVQLQIKTLSSYKFELEHKIFPALGHLKMDKIKPIHLLSFYNNLLEDGVRQDGKKEGLQ